MKSFYVFKLHCLKTFKSNFKVRWRHNISFELTTSKGFK